MFEFPSSRQFRRKGLSQGGVYGHHTPPYRSSDLFDQPTASVLHAVRHRENQTVSYLRGRSLDLPIIDAIAMGWSLMR